MDRGKLSEFLHTFTPNVYFQPGEKTTLEYPCITYDLNTLDRESANNTGYKLNTAMICTFISNNPDWDAPEKALMNWPIGDFNTTFISDNLYHTVLILYI